MAKKPIDIAAVLSGQVSKLDTTAPAFEEVKVDLIDPNEMNFFPVEDDLTDLADSIQLEGLLQPIVVTPTEDGRYRVIAGHRRRAAVLKLKEADPERWQTVPCKIVHPQSKALEELMLIQTNTEAREIGWSEKSTAATRVENILIQLKKDNKIELPGKMRATVAKLIKTSESQIARAKYIKKHLTKEARAIHLNDNCAYRVSHLPEDWQRELVDHFKDNTWRIDAHEIKEFRERKQAGKEPFPPESDPNVRKCSFMQDENGKPVPCDYEEKIKAWREDASLPKDERCPQCARCCQYCDKRIECDRCCEPTQKQIDEHKKSAKYQIGQRLQVAREAADLTREEAENTIYPSSCQQGRVMKEETGLWSIGLDDLEGYCRLYHVSSDAILGLTSDVWHIENPTEPGYYWCITGPLAGGGKLLFWNGNWQHPYAMVDIDIHVLCWIPCPELPERYTWNREALDEETT